MDNRPIGVFDSGVGGLSAVRRLEKLLPGEDIVYFGDTGRMPYGTRSRETIIGYSKEIIAFLLEKDVKMLVAACGTISSNLPDSVVKALPVPYTGVMLPAAQVAAATTSNGRIGLIGTTATVRSGLFGKAIRSIRPETKLFGKACPLLVPMVEEGLLEEDNEIVRLTLEMYLSSIKKEKVDTLILGCTHFSLLYNQVDRVMESKVTLVDAAGAAAQYVQSFLTERDMLGDSSRKGKTRFFVSSEPEAFCETAQKFLGRSISADLRVQVLGK